MIQQGIANLRADYVIVGGGTAGCAIAARLCAKMPNKSFIIIERAPPRNAEAEFTTRSPRNTGIASVSPLIGEIFASLPNVGLKNRVIDFSTGNTLGGSSSSNAQQFIVPVRGTVERWGIRGLTTETSRKFYRRAFEKLVVSPQTGGLRNIYAEEHLQAAIRSGIPENRNLLTDSSKQSIFENGLTVDKRGFRVDSCTGYLTPAMNGACSKNLRLLQGETVTKILLKERKNEWIAKGVEITNTKDRTKIRKVFAKREVILSAGPVGTPKLLQLSGIGPRDVLNDVNIPLKVELPVGKRTQARITQIVSSMYKAPLDPANNSTILDDPVTRAMWERGEGGVLGQSPATLAGRARRDGYYVGFANAFPIFRDQPIISIACTVNPSSFGFIRIKNADAFTSPTIQLALLENKVDLNRAKRCIRDAVEIHRNFPAEFGLQITNPPNGDVTEDFIRETAIWSFHFVGGARVGEVLRPDLRVAGVRKLRVVDASALGSIPVSAGPMASVYMLAEFASERIF